MKIIHVKQKETAQGIISLCNGRIIDSNKCIIEVPDNYIDIIRDEMGSVYVQKLKYMKIIKEISWN
jgi:hypothetical protein